MMSLGLVGIFLLLVVGVVVLIIVLTAGKTRRDSPIARDEPRTDGPDDQVLNQLRLHGSDLTKPHVVDFFLYFRSEESARLAQGELGSEYQSEINETEGVWACKAHATFVPTRAAMVLRRQALTAIAMRHGGEYDGWGAAIVR